MSADIDLAPLGDPGPSSLAHRSRTVSKSPAKSVSKSPAKSAARDPSPSPSDSSCSRSRSRSPSRSRSRSPTAQRAHSSSKSPHASARSHTPGASGTDVEYSDDEADTDEEEYERRRMLNMQKNQNLMAELSLAGASSLFASQLSNTASPKAKTARRRTKHRELRDRNGYILSLPEPGKTHRLACVEIPSDRRIQRMIDDGAYADCTAWSAGEDRRWRFGDGSGVLADGEEVGVVDGVADTFRWRSWEDILREFEPEESYSPIKSEAPSSPDRPDKIKKPKVHYSELTGATCHQCKRKSDKPKMRCRNAECLREYCLTCCARYDFEFDEDSRSWICPFCEDICNCGACRHKKGQAPLAKGEPFGRSLAKIEAEKQGMTLQAYLEQQEGSTRPAPFDRIRFVDAATDILPPPLPQEWEDYFAAQERQARPKVKKIKKRKSTAVDGEEGGEGEGEGSGEGGKGKGGKGKGKGKAKKMDAGDEGEAGATPNGGDTAPKRKKPGPRKKKSLATGDEGATPASADRTHPPIILRIPSRPASRPASRTAMHREVDSDGETVHGYSDEEAVPPLSNRQVRRSASTSTNASENGPIAPMTTNDFLARLHRPEDEPPLPLPMSEGLLSNMSNISNVEMDNDLGLEMHMHLASDLGDVNVEVNEDVEMEVEMDIAPPVLPLMPPLDTAPAPTVSRRLSLSPFPSFPSLDMRPPTVSPNPPTPHRDRDWRTSPQTPGLPSALSGLGSLLSDSVTDPLGAYMSPFNFQFSPSRDRARDRERERERERERDLEVHYWQTSPAGPSERSPRRVNGNGTAHGHAAAASGSMLSPPQSRSTRSPSATMRPTWSPTSTNALDVHSHSHSHSQGHASSSNTHAHSSFKDHFADYESTNSASGSGSGSRSASGSRGAANGDERRSTASATSHSHAHVEYAYQHDRGPGAHYDASLSPPVPRTNAGSSPHKRPPPNAHIVRQPKYLRNQHQQPEFQPFQLEYKAYEFVPPPDDDDEEEEEGNGEAIPWQ